jgi:hypothetical protein
MPILGGLFDTEPMGDLNNNCVNQAFTLTTEIAGDTAGPTTTLEII